MATRKLSLLVAVLCLVVGTGFIAAKLQSSGENMTTQAVKFLDTLDDDQRAQATMGFDDKRRVDWHFIPKKSRKGLQLREMNDKQKKAAHALLKTTLSEVGYNKSTTIMQLEDILHELQGRKETPKRDSLRYYFTIFGEPKAKGKWGLSIEGHHLSLNFVVEDGQVTSHTPAFFAANPALVKADHGVPPKRARGCWPMRNCWRSNWSIRSATSKRKWRSCPTKRREKFAPPEPPSRPNRRPRGFRSRR